ncbi:MAG: ferritin [Kiritimatiellae bacterium]|jgi:ferritin|nr:ferritin [Kiritimatiellia bacterium]
MISKTLTEAINTQITREYFSAYMYLAMANDAMDKGFKGAFNWLSLQFAEEQGHALKLSKYLQDRGAKVILDEIEKPQDEWCDLVTIFKDVLVHEQKVTAWINEIMAIAVQESDFAAQGMLKWFIDEQVEEEANAADMIWMLEMNSESKVALFQADQELGKRVASAPVAE